MEVSAINTSPKISEKSNLRANITTSALSGMGIGAVVNGVENALKQRSILKHPDKFIKTVQEEIDANPEMQEQGKNIIQTITDFVENGKIDKKAICKNAIKGAIFVGILFGSITAISEIMKNHKAKKTEKAETTNSTQKA